MSFGVTLYLNLDPGEMASATRLISGRRCIVSYATTAEVLVIIAITGSLTGESPCASLKLGWFQTPLRWRYRLGVRTGGSQPSNRGSIPRSATKLSFTLFLDRAHSVTVIPVDRYLRPAKHTKGLV